ncbi:Outer membrane chaperone Skp (OmpH) [Acidobacteriia bacterium SbA2]|nr:Outer membrane chaperone Skp (OmpH) [Acidobacteriia bacterium SbA2]
MKTRVSTLTLLFFLGTAPAALLAQSSGAPTKVGLVNIQEAILSTAEGKKSMADLQKKYQPRQQEIQKQNQDIQAITDQLQKQAATLSDDEQRNLNRQLEEKQKLLKRTQEDAQADFGADRDEMFRRIGQKMVKVIQDFAPKNGYSLVIGSDQVPIYYAATEVDLTDQIVKLYDAANPADAATSGGPAAPAPRSSTPSVSKPATKPKP